MAFWGGGLGWCPVLSLVDPGPPGLPSLKKIPPMIMLQVIAQLLHALALVCDVWVVDMPLRRSRTIAVSSDTSFRSSWISED